MSTPTKGKKKNLEKIWNIVEKEYLKNDTESIKRGFAHHMEFTQAKTRYTATDFDCYKALAFTANDRLMERWNDTQQAYYHADAKRVYYLSMEYLIGRSLANNLINLGMFDTTQEALQEMGLTLGDLEEYELDAGLGNGGLGRLASCYLDSMATLQLPGTGYGIRYDYGIFEQKIVNGQQVELPDHWLRFGDPWLIVRPEYQFTVELYGKVHTFKDQSGKEVRQLIDANKVNALAFDLPIPGHQNNTVNGLRLWKAEASEQFNLSEFNKGDYLAAVEGRIMTENISRVLYPRDDTFRGKELRLTQEYFFVSASLQDIIRRFKIKENSWDKFPDKVVIQLNDTHPAIAIPELMHILIDKEGLTWDHAWSITTKTFAYTNHTVMPEALEKWAVTLIGNLLPRHLEIIYEINSRFLQEVRKSHPYEPQLWERVSIIEEADPKQVRMAHLAVVGSFSVNGVAQLHTEILKAQLFADFYKIFPNRFNNKTNGITPRRWLAQANPRLSKLITKVIGEKWVTELTQLKKLVPHAADAGLQEEWMQIKRQNKEDLASYIKKNMQIEVNPDSIFDCQIKRMHEYKRQLLNVLHAITLYNRIKHNPKLDMVPRTIIFGGKSAASYTMAKLIIRLITSVAEVINKDPDVGDRLKVVFLENYRVSLAEKIIPAADLSEQISTAGTEASGTGNMKFTLNGALTIGTLDGANIEIMEEVGKENIFIFGKTADEVAELRGRGYNPWDYYNRSPELKETLDLISSAYFNPTEPDLFKPIIENLLQKGDHYFILADFDSFRDAQKKVSELYRDKMEWARQSILNTANCGKFSSDRSVMEYAKEIWKVTSVKPITQGNKDHPHK
ncbi:MAG: glycogen/starch/alpha-glucan phosphorylase, partial [Pseudomonadota bacterium]